MEVAPTLWFPTNAALFTDCLGWRLTGERPDYPAAFVTDGHPKVTLWQVKDQAHYQGFDRRHNVGLHHLALKVVRSKTFICFMTGSESGQVL